jgi:FAD:protein FMN transferase
MQRYTFPFRAMACDNTVAAFAERPELAQYAAEAAIAEVERIEAKYSRYREDSVVQNINVQAGRGVPAKIDSETAHLLDFANSCHHESDGLFDITAGVLRQAWDFRASPNAAPPSPTELAPLLPLIGWQKVVRGVEHGTETVYLPQTGMELDFGGFGKEYAADRAAAVLLAHGVAHGFVELGGDVVVSGCQADGAPWSLGVRHPRPSQQTGTNPVVATLQIRQGAVATSGDYERFIEVKDSTSATGLRRHSHILNPRTGESIAGFQSVTVLASSCLIAGSLSTIAMLKCANGEVTAANWLSEVVAVSEGSIKALVVGSDGVLNHYP